VFLSHKQHAIKPSQASTALGYLLTSYVSTRAMKPDGNAMANEIHAASSPSDASEVGRDKSGASFSRHWVHRSSISWRAPLVRCARTYHHNQYNAWHTSNPIISTTHHATLNANSSSYLQHFTVWDKNHDQNWAKEASCSREC